MNRRGILKSIAAAFAAPAAQPQIAAQAQPAERKPSPLPLVDYEPKSMLHVHETTVERARFPVIDFHTHLSFSDGLRGMQRVRFRAPVSEILPVMDRRNIRMLVDLAGGYGEGLETAIRTLQTAHPDRFAVFTEPWWAKAPEPDYPRFQADEIERAHRAGARGIKVLKTLGLYLRENVTMGKLIEIDDPRFDPMWETAGA